MVKNLSAMQETWVQFLGCEDTWEKGIATHFSILVWRTPQTEGAGGGATIHGVAKSQTLLSNSEQHSTDKDYQGLCGTVKMVNTGQLQKIIGIDKFECMLNMKSEKE